MLTAHSPRPACDCRWGFHSRCQASSPEPDFTVRKTLPFAPLEALAHVAKASLPRPTCQEAHGLPWGMGTDGFPPTFLNLHLLWARAPGLTYASSTSALFPAQTQTSLGAFREGLCRVLSGVVRPLLAHGAQTSGQQTDNQRQNLRGHGTDGQLICPSLTADLLWARSAIRSRLHMIQTTPLRDCTGKTGAPKT